MLDDRRPKVSSPTVRLFASKDKKFREINCKQWNRVGNTELPNLLFLALGWKQVTIVGLFTEETATCVIFVLVFLSRKLFQTSFTKNPDESSNPKKIWFFKNKNDLCTSSRLIVLIQTGKVWPRLDIWNLTSICHFPTQKYLDHFH